VPSLYELYNISIGNPDLDLEEREILELSLGAEFTSSFNVRLTLYHGEAKNLISQSMLQPNNYINYEKGRKQGFEVEVKYDFGRGTYLSGTYSYQGIGTLDAPTGKAQSWASPRHMGDIMANVRLSRYFNFNADCYFAEGFERQYGDSRDDMSGYAIVNATLIAKKFLKGYEGLELRGSVYNLFDKDYTSPQDPRLPNDLPMPGINFLLEIKYGF
jgi:outer membrane receptor protein involved in Fe transport